METGKTKRLGVPGLESEFGIRATGPGKMKTNVEI